jgi:alpha-glucosidase
MKAMLFASLRGNIIVYQGEELGLEQDEIPFELLQDPEAIANWPLTLSRDGARTPLPWRNEPLGGFTGGTPWLPLSPANLARAVAVQEGDPQSLLHFTRGVLALRKGNAALRHGALEAIATDGPLLLFDRAWRGERLRCLFNLSGEGIAMPHLPAHEVLLAVNGARDGALQAWSALLARV